MSDEEQVLRERIAVLEAALRRMISPETDWENGEVGVGHNFRAIARAALDGTADTGTGGSNG